MLKKAGIFFTFLGLGTYVTDKISGHFLAEAFARMRCGESYLVKVAGWEPCGFDADVSMFVICFAVVACGLALLLIPKLHPKQ